MFFTWQTLEVITLWSFICSIDGCILASASFGAARGYRPLHWATALGLGHFTLGSVGLIVTGMVAIFVSGVSLALSVSAITVLLFWMIRDRLIGHSHSDPPRRSLLLAALAFSGDAIPQGVAIHGHMSHQHQHAPASIQQAFHALDIVSAGLAATFMIGCLVAAYSFLAVAGVRVLSKRFAEVQNALPAAGFGLLFYLWLSMGHALGEVVGIELAIPDATFVLAALSVTALFYLAPTCTANKNCDCPH